MKVIFVFGSNLAGIHGAGAAKYALQFKGAKWGCGAGLQGRSYAIPTKAENVYTTLPIETIKEFVDDFKQFAASHPEYSFDITPIGCGLAGYNHEDIQPLFVGCPSNCSMPVEWEYLQ